MSLFEPEGGPIAGGTEILVHGTSFRHSEHLRCTWDGNRNASLKVVATFVSYHTLRCLSPAVTASELAQLDDTLEVSVDDFVFTARGRPWVYYDPAAFAVSALEPTGGPLHGGTLLDVIGSGFARLGGLVTHGGHMFRNDSWEPHRHTSAGTFCKFSLDAPSRPLPPTVPPFREGAHAISRRTRARGLGAFSPSSTPALGAHSAVVQATFISNNLLRCRTPAFYGQLTKHRAHMKVHVTLNGDFHSTGSLSHSEAAYSVYDPQEARLTSLSRTGGPVEGGTHIIITGKLFSDFTLRTLPNRDHLLLCRFGWVRRCTRTGEGGSIGRLHGGCGWISWLRGGGQLRGGAACRRRASAKCPAALPTLSREQLQP